MNDFRPICNNNQACSNFRWLQLPFVILHKRKVGDSSTIKIATIRNWFFGAIYLFWGHVLVYVKVEGSKSCVSQWHWIWVYYSFVLEAINCFWLKHAGMLLSLSPLYLSYKNSEHCARSACFCFYNKIADFKILIARFVCSCPPTVVVLKFWLMRLKFQGQ